MEISEERADVKMIEIGRRELRAAPTEMGREEDHELAEVALVRANGVRGHVLVQPQVFEEALELILHRSVPAMTGCDSIHVARSASARSDSATFRSAFLRGTLRPPSAVSGSMIPNVMFVGW